MTTNFQYLKQPVHLKLSTHETTHTRYHITHNPRKQYHIYTEYDTDRINMSHRIIRSLSHQGTKQAKKNNTRA